jgi:hypothetical protein
MGQGHANGKPAKGSHATKKLVDEYSKDVRGDAWDVLPDSALDAAPPPRRKA